MPGAITMARRNRAKPSTIEQASMLRATIAPSSGSASVDVQVRAPGAGAGRSDPGLAVGTGQVVFVHDMQLRNRRHDEDLGVFHRRAQNTVESRSQRRLELVQELSGEQVTGRIGGASGG